MSTRRRLANVRQPDEHGRVVVGVSDLALSDDPEGTLITYSLGSCIGVTIYDPVARVGGMLHFMLPRSIVSPEKAEERPAMFGDTGIPLLLESAFVLGAKKERLIVCAAGGAEILNDDGRRHVGTRNRAMLRELFSRSNISLSADETGGNKSRTLVMPIETGRVTVQHRGSDVVLWAA